MYNNVDEPYRHYAEWKSQSQEYILSDILFFICQGQAKLTEFEVK